MNERTQKNINVLKPVCEKLIAEGWVYARLGNPLFAVSKEFAEPREENSFTVATLHKFEGKIPCIIDFRSSSVGGEIEVKFEYPRELDKYKKLPEYAGLLRQTKVPIAKGSDYLYEQIQKNIHQFLNGYRKAYDLFIGEADLKKLKLTVIRRLGEIFGLDLGALNPEHDHLSFTCTQERKDIGPTIEISTTVDSNHNISLQLKNLNEEEAQKILFYLRKKNKR